MSQELITVIIPTFNRFVSVQKSINSVLNQNWKNLEIIVIDDCSTQKEYIDLPKIYADEPRVKIIRLQKNMRELYNSKYAQGMTRNEGIKIAKGEWIAFLDDDDFYYSYNKLEVQIELMKELNKQACCTNMLLGSGLDDSTYIEPYFKTIVGKNINQNLSIIDSEILQQSNVVNNSTVVLHKNIIEKIGLQKLVFYEDYEYWKLAVNHTDFIYLHVPTVGYDANHAGGSQYLYKK
jgi:teichuronic acid biosynthesis glycosyltransferase TuaG